MKINSPSDNGLSPVKRAALLWDESFLWGIMAYKALETCGLSFDFIRAADVKQGRLRDYTLLFVPGGWASNKAKALGEDGIAEIRNFVHNGGAYLGFCGGAGLATKDGIGLLPVTRRPTKDRVPSFSGRIKLNVYTHPIWKDVRESEGVHSELRTQNSELIFYAWWPSQFVIDPGTVNILATYGDALPDAFSSDLNVGDVETAGKWTDLEQRYAINLDPKRLTGEPAVIEGSFGKGKVLLSLVHFDTPGDPNGAAMLQNLWNYFGCERNKRPADLKAEPLPVVQHDPVLSRLEASVDSLIELGQRNFLWFWRNPMLLQWRRGVRGLEYCTLFIMVQEIAGLLKTRQRTGVGSSAIDDELSKTVALLLPFVEQAKQLLIRERVAMLNSNITYERCEDTGIQTLREELFSRSKSHGGRFKESLDQADRLLYQLKTAN